MDYPKEWDELPRHERRKKIKALKREQGHTTDIVKKAGRWGLLVIVVVAVIFGLFRLTQKSPEQIEFEQQLETVSLEGRVEEFAIEGAAHVAAGSEVTYQTNPPTSGDHSALALNWGVYDEEVNDLQVVHALEHGGIWISYTGVSDDEVAVLEEIGRQNPQSTVVSPRSGNDDAIAVVSWGRMMRLDSADKAVIQKYIDTFKNQSPEPLAN